MTTIKVDYGNGGEHLDPIDGNVPLAETLRDIADDLGSVQPAVIASANASDLATAITLVNEIKAAINANANATIKTIKG